MLLEVFVCILALLLALWISSSPFYWRSRGVACTLPIPLLGHAHIFFTSSQREQALILYKRWKEVPYWGYHMFMEPALGVREPSLIMKILSSDCFLSNGMYSGYDRDPIGPSLLFSSGEAWRQTRAKLSSSFSPAKIRGLLPVVDESLSTAVVELCAESNTGKPVAASELALSFATDAVTRNAFGLKSDAFESNSFLVSIQRHMLKTGTLFKAVLGLVSPKIYDALGLTLLGKRINEQLGQVIGGVVENRLRGIGTRTDFMQYLVDLLGSLPQETSPRFNSDGTRATQINVRWVVAQGFTMYMAGTEALANTLSFALYELAFNPEIQERCRKEALSVSNDTSDLYEAAFTLPYISMVINEVLRMYPLLSSFTRRCTKEFEICDGVVVKKGMLVTIPVFGLHMDPDFFPDPTTFRPERHSAEGNIAPGTFYPYGYGQRICIGMRFGQSSLALALVRLLSKFRFSPCDKTQVPLPLFRYAVTTTPENPIYLTVEKI